MSLDATTKSLPGPLRITGSEAGAASSEAKAAVERNIARRSKRKAAMHDQNRRVQQCLSRQHQALLVWWKRRYFERKPSGTPPRTGKTETSCMPCGEIAPSR